MTVSLGRRARELRLSHLSMPQVKTSGRLSVFVFCCLLCFSGKKNAGIFTVSLELFEVAMRSLIISNFS